MPPLSKSTNNPPEKKNVAVVGTGWFGNAHCRVTSLVANLKAVCDTDLKRANATAAKYDVRPYTDFQTMLDVEDLDAIIVATPPAQTAQIGLIAVERGLDVLLEKPMATKIEDLLKIKKHENKVRIMPGFIEWFNPALQLLESYIKDGAIGAPIYASSKRIGRYPHRNWGIGVLLDLGIHEIYIQQKLFGKVKLSTIKSQLSYLHTPEFEDAAVVFFEFEKGVNGLIEANWMTPTKAREMIVYGDEGAVEVDYVTKQVTLLQPSKDGNSRIDKKTSPYNPPEPLKIEVETFLYGDKIPFDLNDAVETLKIALLASNKITNEE
ncbi:MAG: Gfo/Idh/MocA family protein [Candidatus Ranarchaeia archaeon]|jgi:predicted dehydrogenase